MTRVRWMIVGAGVSYVSKRQAEKSVDRATEALEQRLPPSVLRVTDSLPTEVVRAAGTVVAASGAVRKGASMARSTVGATGVALAAGRSATDAVKMASGVVSESRRMVGRRVLEFTNDLKVQTELERRELKSEYIRHSEGDGPALEALLDLRPAPDGELPVTPEPVAAGRRRFQLELPAAPVNRVQRTYRRATKPWDR